MYIYKYIILLVLLFFTIFTIQGGQDGQEISPLFFHFTCIQVLTCFYKNIKIYMSRYMTYLTNLSKIPYNLLNLLIKLGWTGGLPP